MGWWQAILLGIVQGLTEFLPVSSSGHLMIARELFGVEAEGFLDFTVMVHFGTVLSTVVIFWGVIWNLLKGLLKFRYNDETDYVCKIIISMIPVFVVGMFFKDNVEALFGDSLATVAVCLLVTAALLLLSDMDVPAIIRRKSGKVAESDHRNGISYLQAFIVGLGQAVAVAPGLSRSGTTIATGLITGVKRSVMAEFSFLMVLVPILGEQLLDLMDGISGEAELASGVGTLPLLLGFISAFVSGLFACKVMVALVKKSKLRWFAVYCAVVAAAIFIFA
ncbi:MAG: undecaprenyl-diphosphate phosphatase [Bacteroidales bacterium]|nr:undecaprenyl-diphosphate phosphatase [Bacteroidales bacterium]